MATSVESRERISDGLRRSGVSIRALARLCGVNHAVLARYLRSEKSLADAWKVADAAQDLAEYIERVQAETGMRPDVRDTDALRAALARLRDEREDVDQADSILRQFLN